MLSIKNLNLWAWLYILEWAATCSQYLPLYNMVRNKIRKIADCRSPRWSTLRFYFQVLFESLSGSRCDLNQNVNRDVSYFKSGLKCDLICDLPNLTNSDITIMHELYFTKLPSSTSLHCFVSPKCKIISIHVPFLVSCSVYRTFYRYVK